MRTTKRLRLILAGQSRDRAPAGVPQACRRSAVMSDRQEYLVAELCSKAGVDQRIGVKGKADCSFGAAIGTIDLIAAAAPQCADKSIGIEREAEPVLIFKDMSFGPA